MLKSEGCPLVTVAMIQSGSTSWTSCARLGGAQDPRRLWHPMLGEATRVHRGELGAVTVGEMSYCCPSMDGGCEAPEDTLREAAKAKTG